MIERPQILELIDGLRKLRTPIQGADHLDLVIGALPHGREFLDASLAEILTTLTVGDLIALASVAD